MSRSIRSGAGRRARMTAAVALGLLLTATLLPVATVAARDTSRTGTYIVRMAADPAVAYRGGVRGIAATRPAAGARLDAAAPNVRAYSAHLERSHAAALGRVGRARKLYDYTYTLNGFAARMTAAQAEQLARQPGVVSVEPDRIVHVDTSSTPHFLGLDARRGLWNQLGGPDDAGEDVIIGIVDTGIWPEHPSFSDRIGDRYSRPPKGWTGTCQEGEEFTAADCNRKLIGARFYNAGFGPENIADRDFLSPRDWNGHGSHTASTAGGNHRVRTTGDAALFGRISGMAPRARIAAYKVCWEDEGAGGCSTADSVEAIDQAVADGVDVINYSISGSRTDYLDAVEVAFLFAADAGVFVATSAGNEGPGGSTVAHISPWLTATAAGSHNRAGNGTVTLGNGAAYAGQSVAATQVSGDLVRSTDVKLAAADPNEARLCFLGTLDPALAAGKIIHCDRGVNARIDKSLEVKNAGGLGMVMTNTSANSVNADLHFVPSIHTDHVAGAAIKAYMDAPGTATATISMGTIVFDAPAPTVATFSSRGPSLAGGGDVLKPDILAPGVDVLAAVAPPGNHGREFDLLSGTSMASPHIAGIAALLKDLHPKWSPMAIKSAMMTTAGPVIAGPGTAGNPLGYGAGQVNPNGAADPGLVYDHGFSDWLRFIEGQGLIDFAGLDGIDASDLNQASIAIGDLAGVQTITRTVTNVGSRTETYRASASLAGHSILVQPSRITLPPGRSATFTVRITRTTAALGEYAFGSLTWQGSRGHVVRSPMAVRPVALSAPAELHLAGASGSTSWSIRAGYSGSLTVAEQGLVAAQTFPGNVTDDPTNSFDTTDPTGNQGITTHDVAVPAGTAYARFSLFDEETDGADDLDLYVYQVGAGGALTLVGASGTGTSAEEVNLGNPAAATYRVFVHGWQTDGPDANYTLFAWTVGPDVGNMTATTDGAVVLGTDDTIGLTWTGLSAATRYLGRVVYGDGTNPIGATVVAIDVP